MRKTLAMLFVAASLSALAACAGGPALPPKAGPEEVEVINQGQQPREGFRTLGPISVSRPMGTEVEDVIMEIRRQAARMGADAIVIQTIGRTSEDQSRNFEQDQQIIVTALAIYYPVEGAGSSGS